MIPHTTQTYVCTSLSDPNIFFFTEKHTHFHLDRGELTNCAVTSSGVTKYTLKLVIKTGTRNNLKLPIVACRSNRQMRYWTRPEHSKRNKKNCTARTKHKAAVHTSFLRTGWLRTRLLALGVGAKRWSVKKQSKKRATIAASPWRTTAKPSLPFKAPPP